MNYHMESCDQTTLTTSLVAGGLFLLSEILARAKNIKGNSVSEIIQNVLLSVLVPKKEPAVVEDLVNVV